MKKPLLLLFLSFLLFNYYAVAQTPDANGIVYVKPTATGTGNGDTWANATNNLQGAINATGTQKVFVAVGNYNVPSPHSFTMKNNVEIYGGFDPVNNITNLTHRRIMPNAVNSQGSILNGKNERPIIWNVSNGVTATAVLDGFALINATGSTEASIYNSNTSPTLKNLLITGNYTSGVYNTNASPTLTNVCIANNTNDAGIIQNGGTTVANNITVAGNGTALILVLGGIVVNNSLICGTVNGNLANLNLNSSLITIDPVVIANLFSDGVNGDYSLKHDASAVNAGNNALFVGLTTNTKDLAGNSRLYGLAIDMGAYEYQLTPDVSGIIYVKETATGTGKGNNWDNATADLQGAINTTGTQKVFVAKGYYPTNGNSFIMRNGVEIYGGFDPDNGITDLSHNRILPNETISGTVLDGQNAQRVIFNNFSSVNPLNHTAILDGFTLKNGYVNNQQGAGMLNYAASPTLRNIVLRDNVATGGTGSGGGMYNDDNSSPIISNALFFNNTVEGTGLAIYNAGGSNPIITNTVIKKHISFGGILIYNSASNPVFINTLVVDNEVLSIAYSNGNNTTVTWRNVTVANNLRPNGLISIAINNGFGSTASISNSIVFGVLDGGGTVYANSFMLGNTDASNGNINTSGITANDVFVNLSAGDYTLKATAPVIDKGNNALYSGLASNTLDLAGNSRVFNFSRSGIIDLGAYEFNLFSDANHIVYVKPTATGTGSGNSWANATGNLQVAIDVIGVQKVFVAKGDYPTNGNSFVMRNGVEIYGGFDPDNGITNLTHNRILPNKGEAEGSVLNGQNAGRTISNIFSVGNPLSNTAVLDGFTIKNGYHNGNGGGIYNKYASPILRNLVIKNNNADNPGGGIFNSDSSPLVSNSIITGNKTNVDNGGGAVDVNSSPTYTNVLFTKNISTYAGGAIYRGGTGTTILTNVTIADNSANGAIYLNGGAFTAHNTIIYGGILKNSGQEDYQNSLVEGKTNTVNGNINATGITIADVFADVTNGDYSLKSTSPAINAGSNALLSGLDENTTDLFGNQRVYKYNNNGVIDLGAYEYQGDAPLLPVTMVEYTAKIDGNKAKLQWQTASEQDNAKFVVYRSNDGQVFKEMGERLGAGTSTTVNSYSLYDHQPLKGTNYYQLIQVDRNGKTTDLGIRTVNFNLQPFDVKLYPNPTDDAIHVLFGNGNFTSIKLIDVNGQILQHIKLDQLETNKKISLIDYPSGVYFLQLTGRDGTATKKVLKK